MPHQSASLTARESGQRSTTSLGLFCSTPVRRLRVSIGHGVPEIERPMAQKFGLHGEHLLPAPPFIVSEKNLR